MSAPQAPDQQELGRRVAFRREELGLSYADVAHRAAMTTEFVRRVEAGDTPIILPQVLLRLAATLETSVNDLLGKGVERPPGRRGPRQHARLEELSAGESRRLLAHGGVGRFVFCTDRGPVALPVNFRVVDGDFVFRTTRDTSIASVNTDDRVGFEVDNIDDPVSEGWSVLASGRVEHVEDTAEVLRLKQHRVEPWAGEDGRDLFLRFVPDLITGRRIRSR